MLFMSVSDVKIKGNVREKKELNRKYLFTYRPFKAKRPKSTNVFIIPVFQYFTKVSNSGKPISLNHLN